MMTVLLASSGTGSYYGKDIAWAATAEGAVEFGTLAEVGRMAWKCWRKDVVVVLRYENPDCELTLNQADGGSSAANESQGLQA